LNSSGNSTYGNYAGTSITYVNPYYDYTAAFVSLAYNYGAVIKAARIRAHNKARQTFMNLRISNLRIGRLNPGERVTGYVHYQLPVGFDGPYLVVVKAGTLGIVQFNLSKK
ncbi:MAG TPA: hypothetical protein VFI27_07265, partial [candidate division Zixibacteria bacterium]|nr:hypothetical protein [candidate division Zixibacteria bacterium]